MMAQLQLDIVTPDCTLISKKVDYVGATGVEGEFGILPQHMPMLAALCVGRLFYREKDETHFVFVNGGFAEVFDNRVTVLTEVAELAENIDAERARRAKARAEQRLSEQDERIDESRARAALTRAVTRLHIAGMQ